MGERGHRGPPSRGGFAGDTWDVERSVALDGAIAAARERRPMTVAQAAALLGVGRQSIEHVERLALANLRAGLGKDFNPCDW